MLDDPPGPGAVHAAGHPRTDTDWDAFCSARERFLARLAELSEITRLERTWTLQAPSDGEGGSSSGP
jgi:hypothetical protein